MNILVTGGAGFIGSHLTNYLVKRGENVIVLDNLLRGNKIEKAILSDVDLIEGDIRDEDLIYKLCRKCDIIYHLAAVLGVDVVAENPLETMDVEAVGIKNIVKGSIKGGVEKIIYSSTSGVYGKNIMEKAVTEDLEVSPRSSYSIAKRFCEIYLASTFEEQGVNTISVRLFNVYGARQDDRMVIPRFIDQALHNKPITVFGSGDQTRDFTFIDDVIKSIISLGDNYSGNDVFNIARGEDLTIFELAKFIKDFFNSSSEIIKCDVPGHRYDFEVEKRFGNSDKLEKAINYRPSTSFNEGFKKIY